VELEYFLCNNRENKSTKKNQKICECVLLYLILNDSLALEHTCTLHVSINKRLRSSNVGVFELKESEFLLGKFLNTD
jgi:hypothetical protein